MTTEMKLYRTWLQNRYDWYLLVGLEEAEKNGAPGNIRYASQVLREIIEAYEDCLDEFDRSIGHSATP